jgi:2-haloacid dehalogenase
LKLSDFEAISFDCYGTRAGLETVFINRRGDRAGWGATPAPATDIRPDWEFPSMAAFAAAASAELP